MKDTTMMTKDTTMMMKDTRTMKMKRIVADMIVTLMRISTFGDEDILFFYSLEIICCK
jgi:hypothetical protein